MYEVAEPSDRPSTADYIAANRERFYRRGKIQWLINCIRNIAPEEMSDADRVTLADLHETRCALVTKSLNRFAKPNEQVEKFQFLRDQVESIGPSAWTGEANDTEQARAWFDTNRFERFCDRNGKAPSVVASYAAVSVVRKSITQRDLETLSRMDARKLSRLQRQLEEVTTEIVIANEPLVQTYVQKFASSADRHDIEEYLAAGQLGVMKALAAFDPDAGRFDTWAFKHLQREILHAFRANEYTHLNHADFERRPAVLKARDAVQAKLGNDGGVPTYEEIAEVAGMTVDQVQRVLESPSLASLSVMVGEEDGSTLGDVLASEELPAEAVLATKQMLTAVEKFGLSVLDTRELLVMVRRYGLDEEPAQKLASIGKTLGRSREGVRQAEARALAKLRHPIVLRRILRSRDTK
jgi:RNA polymerase sigma factor (sigma-70 family)